MGWWYLRLTLAIFAFKLLLAPSYRSTDFEVHRNWMAITNSLPLSSWYLDETSKWTLDYPPFFAWLEYAFSIVAKLIDPEMLKLTNLNYQSEATVIYQRITVVLSESILAAVSYKEFFKLPNSKGILVYALVLANAGLIIVDNIHFQYNSLLIGILMWAVLEMENGKIYKSASLFTILLNMKHLFIYSAPIFFSYLLTTVFPNGKNGFYNLFKLAFIVIFIFSISFAPFIYHSQIPQILKRLFPFGRGLCHSYWAPNAWALYAFVDKGTTYIHKISNFQMQLPRHAQMTGGLVGITKFNLLPQISPFLSLIIVLLFISLCSVALYRNPKPQHLMEAVAYANFTGFIWGYHVHEKAILTVLIPLIFVAYRPKTLRIIKFSHNDYFYFSFVAHYSLLPLLHEPQEYPFKIILILSYSLFCHIVNTEFKTTQINNKSNSNKLINYVKVLYIIILCALELYASFIHSWLFKEKFEFMPLMLISVYSAIFLFGYWVKFTYEILTAVGIDCIKIKKM